MKWCYLSKTLHDLDDAGGDDDDDSEEEIKDPMMFTEEVSHFGSVNRIRTMCNSNIVATWSEEKEV